MIYVGCQKPGDSLISKLIASKGAPGLYSHAAVLFVEDQLLFSAHADYGVRFIDLTQDSQRWDWWKLEINAAIESRIRDRCELMAGDGYDFAGVMAFECKFFKQDRTKHFCSESVIEVIQPETKYYQGVVACQIKPNDLANLNNKQMVRAA